jgi:hypothetical protein
VARFLNVFAAQKVYFSRLMRVYVGNFGGVYLGFLVSYWSEGFGTFLQVSALVSHWLKDYVNFSPTLEENDQYSASYS